MEQDVINFLRDWFGPLPWVEILVASGVLSAALLIVRKWRLYRNAEALFAKEWFTDTMVMLLAFGEALVSWFISANFDNPKLVAFQGLLQAFTMNRLYIWILKPWYIRLKTKLAPKVELARRLNAELAAQKPEKKMLKNASQDEGTNQEYLESIARPEPQNFAEQSTKQ